MTTPISRIAYKGKLRTECTHLPSKTQIATDAPVDNHGKGEKFSPTDLTATALASCMITLMGIAANTHSFELRKVNAEVFKTMASNPRRIHKVQINLEFPEKSYSDKEKKLLKTAAINCPVAKSLHPDIEQDVRFRFE